MLPLTPFQSFSDKMKAGETNIHFTCLSDFNKEGRTKPRCTSKYGQTHFYRSTYFGIFIYSFMVNPRKDAYSFRVSLIRLAIIESIAAWAQISLSQAMVLSVLISEICQENQGVVTNIANAVGGSLLN